MVNHSTTVRRRAGQLADAPGQVSSLLLNLNFEERVVGVLMAPREVLLLLGPLHSIEITIFPLLLLEICAVSTIFVAVPRMVILAAAIVVAFFVMVCVVRSSHDRADRHRGAQYQRAQN
jgi:hypothetical protein